MTKEISSKTHYVNELAERGWILIGKELREKKSIYNIMNKRIYIETWCKLDKLYNTKNRIIKKLKYYGSNDEDYEAKPNGFIKTKTNENKVSNDEDDIDINVKTYILFEKRREFIKEFGASKLYHMSEKSFVIRTTYEGRNIIYSIYDSDTDRLLYKIEISNNNEND